VRTLAGTQIEVKADESDTLAFVYAVLMERTGESNFMLSIPYPRKVFTSEDLDLVTLKAAGYSSRYLHNL